MGIDSFILDQFEKGGPLMWPLALCSLAASCGAGSSTPTPWVTPWWRRTAMDPERELFRDKVRRVYLATRTRAPGEGSSP